MTQYNERAPLRRARASPTSANIGGVVSDTITSGRRGTSPKTVALKTNER